MNYIDATEEPAIDTGAIRIHGDEAFAAMREVGGIAARCLDGLVEGVKPGITTAAIDDFVYGFALDHGVLPATLGYRGYRKSCCTSVNHVICHGIPGNKTLRHGDIVNIDVTFILDGWHGDTSRMYLCGKVKPAAKRLVDVTYEAMLKGIEAARPGNRTGDIGAAIQTWAESHCYSVVRDFCGHGLGRLFHDSPKILHYGRPGEGVELRPGMFFTIEPMINLGGYEIRMKPDRWTAVTRDRSLSAQFEHSIGITETGHEVFTLSPAGLHAPPFGSSKGS